MADSLSLLIMWHSSGLRGVRRRGEFGVGEGYLSICDGRGFVKKVLVGDGFVRSPSCFSHFADLLLAVYQHLKFQISNPIYHGDEHLYFGRETAQNGRKLSPNPEIYTIPYKIGILRLVTNSRQQLYNLSLMEGCLVISPMVSAPHKEVFPTYCIPNLDG